VKWLSKQRVHLMIWSALVIYLVLFDPLHKRIFHTVGWPASIGFIDLSQTSMDMAIDQLSQVRYAGQTVYQLMGWAIPRNDQVSLNEYDKQIVLIDQQGKGFVFAAQTVERYDLGNTYHGHAEDSDLAGFSAYISEFALSAGPYRIGVLYTSHDFSSVFRLTDTFIVRTPNVLKLVDSYTALDDTPDDWIEKLRLVAGLESYSVMAYDFDRLKIVSRDTHEIYLLGGWAFPLVGDRPLNEYRKRVVLVDERSVPHLLDAESVRRPDVQEAYADLGRDLNLSGFAADLSVPMLRPGVYRLGLLLTDRDSSSIYFPTNTGLVRTAGALRLVTLASPLDDLADDWIERVKLLAGMQGQSEMAYDFDRLQITGRGDGEIYQLAGWAFPWVGDRPLNAYRKHIVLLDERSVPHLLEAEPVRRPDVQAAYADLGRDLNLSGFSVNLSIPMLRPGVYRLGLLFTAHDSSSLFQTTDQCLQWAPTALQLISCPKSGQG
jgi:hypothetical protein